ncbi:MAG TPA: hypothetical protein VMV86_02075 [Methanosarcinales archaeon]|nr:hypothetical protein [Methanosarcinales archaeon]
MDIYIKNADTIAHVWSGQQIQPGEYYLLEESEKTKWQNNSQFLTDVANSIAILARSGSGSDDIIDISEAISFLKEELPKNENGLPLMAPTFEDTQGLTTVWKSHLYTATAGALSIFDEPVLSQIKVRGGWYELFSSPTEGDYVEFSVIDKDDVLGLFSTYGLTIGVDILELKKFVRTEYINPNSINARQEFLSNGATSVYAGLYMRVAYLSTGLSDVVFKITEKYHEV